MALDRNARRRFKRALAKPMKHPLELGLPEEAQPRRARKRTLWQSSRAGRTLPAAPVETRTPFADGRWAYESMMKNNGKQ